MPEAWRQAQAFRDSPAHRIELIEASQRCLLYGWLSWLPLLGVFFTGPAVVRFFRTTRDLTVWNPAHHLAVRGMMLTSVGGGLSLLTWYLFLWWTGIMQEEVGFGKPTNGDGFAWLVVLVLPVSLIGLGFAVSRWQSRVGALLRRLRRLVLVAVLTAYGAVVRALLTNATYPFGTFEESAYLLFAAALAWGLFGAVLLAALQPRSRWWWYFWLLGTGLLCALGFLV